MENINKEDYLKALEIIEKYKISQKGKILKNFHTAQYEVNKMFEKFGIKDYEFNVEESSSEEEYQIIIYPIDTQFDEDYGGQCDKELNKISKKYDVSIQMTDSIYGK